MDAASNDKRFENVAKDPRFRRVPASTKKVTVDKRFSAMFKDKKFKLKYTVDKRGRPTNLTSSEQLKKFYNLDAESSEADEEDNDEKQPEQSDEEEEVLQKQEAESEDEEPQPSTSKQSTARKTKAEIAERQLRPGLTEDLVAKLRDPDVDYARGEAALHSESSSEEESEEEEDEEVFHEWGELDKDAGETDTATRRLAICNMDWDNIRAVDLMVLLQSFAPPGGTVEKTTIYPSEFGLERMREEETLGPKELQDLKHNGDQSYGENENRGDGEEDGEDGDDYTREKLRQYQLKRLKYYYAVAECESAETANKIYEECDGQEFESSAARLDLRFIPDDMTFDQEVKDVCDTMPDSSRYEPNQFLTSALQQSRVHLTWDETDPSRRQVIDRIYKTKNGKQVADIDEEALKGLLATSSEDEDEEEEEAVEEDETTSCISESDRIAKYRNLLVGIAQSEEEAKKRKGEVEMEISWGVGLKEKAEQLVKKKLAEKNAETTWEEHLAKRREKIKARRKEKKQLLVAPASEDDEPTDIPSDIDMNDPYFKEEFESEEFQKPKKRAKISEKEKELEEAQRAAELELLLMDEDDGKRHFSMKSIIKEAKTGKKDKKKATEEPSKTDDFKVQVDDPRFSALYTSHHYNLDPSDPNFKKTGAMEAILQEKLKRRVEARDEPLPKPLESEKGKRVDAELSRLVNSVKVKTSMQKDRKANRAIKK